MCLVYVGIIIEMRDTTGILLLYRPKPNTKGSLYILLKTDGFCGKEKKDHFSFNSFIIIILSSP